MTQIYIDGNDIKRVVSLKFDIDAPISYEDFCKDSRYEEIFEDMKKKDSSVSSLFSIFLLSTGYDGWISQNIRKKIDLLFQYDFIEEYKNGMSFDWHFNHKEDEKFPRKKWFFDDHFDFQINEMKHYFTKNYFVLDYKLRQKYTHCSAKLINPDIMRKLQNAGYYQCYLSCGRKIRKNIKFTQELRKHKRMEYISFMALITDEPFYLVTNRHFFDFYIVSESNLPKYIKGLSLVQNISEHVKYIQEEETLQQIEKLKQLYGKDRDQMKKVMTDMMDMIKKTGTLKINLNVQDHVPMYMTGSFKSKDIDRYLELKHYTSDYGYVARKNYKGSKKIIVGEKEFKYKKSGKNKEKK